MSEYYIKAIILKSCPYSINAEQLLKTHKIKSDFNYIDHDEKNKYKTPFIDTFPQIYLNKNGNKGNLLLGGYTDLSNFLNNFKNKKLENENIDEFMKKYNWSKKATLRLIELINL